MSCQGRVQDRGSCDIGHNYRAGCVARPHECLPALPVSFATGLSQALCQRLAGQEEILQRSAKRRFQRRPVRSSEKSCGRHDVLARRVQRISDGPGDFARPAAWPYEQADQRSNDSPQHDVDQACLGKLPGCRCYLDKQRRDRQRHEELTGRRADERTGKRPEAEAGKECDRHQHRENVRILPERKQKPPVMSAPARVPTNAGHIADRVALAVVRIKVSVASSTQDPCARSKLPAR